MKAKTPSSTSVRERCWICGRYDAERASHGKYNVIHCPRACGRYKIDCSLEDSFAATRSAEAVRRRRRYLGCYTRKLTEEGKIAHLQKDNWRGFAQEHRDTKVKTKEERLLALFAGRAGRPARYVEYDVCPDGFIVGEPNIDLFTHLVYHLDETRKIELDPYDDSRCRVTIEGWIEYESYSSKRSKNQPASETKSDPERVSPRIANDAEFADIGTRLRQARLAYHDTQDKAAEKFGVRVSTVARWERGETKPYRSRLKDLLDYIDKAPTARSFNQQN